MEQNKYIPGDWVKYRGNNSPRYVQIWQVRENFLFLESGYGIVDFSEVEPIPLTPEILQKNGWEKDNSKSFEDDDEPEYENRYLNRTYGLSLDLDENEVYKGTSGILMGLLYEVIYVHQLQHLLFGLGLDSNFELEDIPN